MRFKEINLSEADLQGTSTKSWPGYLQNLISSNNIGLGNQGEVASGLELDEKSKKLVQSLITQFDASDNQTKFAKDIENTVVTFTSGVSAPIKKIHKSADIKGGATSKGSEKKPWNEGEVAETILGAALYARFTKKGNISGKDVDEALKVFVGHEVPGGFKVEGTKRNGKNPITMIAINKQLNNAVIQNLVNKPTELEKLYPNGVKGLKNKIDACAKYVNESAKVKVALEEADSNEDSPITIKTDGVGDQKGTKADLQIEIGKFKQLLSLKVNDVKQFGQESGSSGAVVTSFFKRFIPDLDLSDLYMKNGEPMPWTPETGRGWPDTDNKKYVNQLKQDDLWDDAVDHIYNLIGKAYQLAAKNLKGKLSTPEGAAQAITDLYNGIIHHVQGNAQFQTLVILNPDTKTAWKELEFGPDLAEALKNYKMTVSVDIAPWRGVGNHKLQIFGTPITPTGQVAAQTTITSPADAKKAKIKADSGKVSSKGEEKLLIQLRSYVQETGNIRNPVEMGALLKDLTEVQKIEDLPDVTDTAIVDKPEIQQPPAQPANQGKPVQLPQQQSPSKVTNIEPAPPIQPQDSEQEDELASIKRNAGLKP